MIIDIGDSMIGSLDIATLRAAYAAGGLTPADLVAAIYDRIAARGEDAVWITLVPREAALARATELMQGLRALPPEDMPLWGVPFAVKDNIDAAGLPTTAACPAFAYTPTDSALAVERLLRAGAILIGKTNLDQFATGLVGVRSPYGVARNPFGDDVIPGGSSSGSAVAVGAGLVSFALGTDTAGSGRVPAGFNNIVGLKPSIGLISATGMVPACRSLDCISVFANTVADSLAVLQAAAAYDARDGYSRPAPTGWSPTLTAPPARFRFGLPQAGQLKFFGNAAAETLFGQAVARLQALGGEAIEIDYAPFAEAASFLYQPAGTAERTAALGDFLSSHAADMHPVTRGIIERGRDATAVDVHNLYYRLRELRQQTAPVWQQIDVMLVPTSGTVYRIAEVEADPVTLNSNLGYYTNFVNYFDLSALSVPNGFQPDGLPAGITLIGPAFSEPKLAALGHAFHAATGLTMGAGGYAPPATGALAPVAANEVEVVVFGAHLSGEPLNPQLLDLGARLVGPCRTSADYRLFALKERLPRPGLLRVGSGGAAIEGEIWALSPAAFGTFVAGIAMPLGIADVRLSDGRLVKGFVCEAAAAAGATEITDFGGWRAYRRASAAA